MVAAVRNIGIEYFCLGKKFLIFNLVSRNLKIKYRRSILGVFWTLLSPLSMAVVYYFVFKVVLKVQMPNYLALVLSGVLPWAFFAQSTIEGMESIVNSQGLLSKVPVPPQIFPFVGVFTNLITLGLAVPIVFITAFWSGVDLGTSVVLLPLLFGCLFLITYGLSLILAHLFVFFRDLRHLMTLVMQIWFYGTPVIYDENMIPEKYSWILYANPLGTMFTSLHDVFARGVWPSREHLLALISWTLGITIAARLFQTQFSHEIVENL